MNIEPILFHGKVRLFVTFYFQTRTRSIIYSFQHSSVMQTSYFFFTTAEHADDAEADRLDGESGWPVFGENWQADVSVAIYMWMNWYVGPHKCYLHKIFKLQANIQINSIGKHLTLSNGGAKNSPVYNSSLESAKTCLSPMVVWLQLFKKGSFCRTVLKVSNLIFNKFIA